LTGVRACELLTAEDIESATGRAPAEGQDMSRVGGRLPIRGWAPAGGQSFDTLVNLLVTVNAYDTYAEFVESARSSPAGAAFSDDDIEEVSGVGDFGVWMGEARMLQIYAGDQMVQITVGASAAGEPLAVARALGEAALNRLR
jgi:hypothetical protein